MGGPRKTAWALTVTCSARGRYMATVRLTWHEVSEGLLPPVCMKCGAPSTGHAKKTFSWHPPWVIVLILGGLLPWAIVAAILTKRMTVRAPMCPAHRSHWLGRAWFVWGGFIALLAVGFGAVILLAN